MIGKVAYSRGARHELVLLYRQFVREAGMRVADKFLNSAEGTLLRLATMPHLGVRYDHPTLTDLRFCPLPSRFKKYLVFYRPTSDGIEIARILHGARDISSILTEEFRLDESDADENAEDEIG